MDMHKWVYTRLCSVSYSINYTKILHYVGI